VVDNVGLMVVSNGSLKEAGAVGDKGFETGTVVYEVMRIIRGVPLFYMDHFNRLKHSVNAVGRELSLTSEQLKEDVKKLLSANKADNCNVKVLLALGEGGSEDRVTYISKSYYPTQEQVAAGVKTGLFQIERQKPNAKILNKSYKEAVEKRIEEGSFFEVLLTDSRGRITEGSKSNAFFVKDGFILTAPGEYVLKGITRQYVLEAGRNAGYEVVEDFVEARSLGKVDAAFLSGTSIKVLPIKTVDDILLDSSKNQIVAAVGREYDRILEKYIEDNVNIW